MTFCHWQRKDALSFYVILIVFPFFKIILFFTSLYVVSFFNFYISCDVVFLRILCLFYFCISRAAIILRIKLSISCMSSCSSGTSRCATVSRARCVQQCQCSRKRVQQLGIQSRVFLDFEKKRKNVKRTYSSRGHSITPVLSTQLPKVSTGKSPTSDIFAQKCGRSVHIHKKLRNLELCVINGYKCSNTLDRQIKYIKVLKCSKQPLLGYNTIHTLRKGLLFGNCN